MRRINKTAVHYDGTIDSWIFHLYVLVAIGIHAWRCTMRKARAIFVALARTQNCWRVGQYTTFRFRYGAIHVCYRTRKEISCVTFFLVDKYRFRRNCCYNWFVCMCWSVCKIGVYIYMFVCCDTRQIFDERFYVKRERRNGVVSHRRTWMEIELNSNWLTI